jgi:hypothetical protein
MEGVSQHHYNKPKQRQTNLTPPNKQPPYAPQTATIGGTPNTNIDIPITSIFLALYLTFAAANMTILQTNQTRSHKFLISGPIFGFCMARTTTCTLRIVWAAYPHNVRIAMAAQILNNAGILIVYIVNLIFAQRVLRGKQPKIGWNPLLSRVFRICYVLIGGVLVMVITATVITYYTLDMQTKLACAGALKAAIVFLFFVTLAPLLLLAAAFFLLPRDENSEQAFGTRSMETKALVVFLIACLTITIAGFKLGTTFETPRPVADPAWYHSKAAFYSFGFVLEIVILCVVQIARVDRVFHVPDGSSAVKSYWAASQVDGKEMEASGRRESGDF